MMANDLFFLPLIEKALRDGGRDADLRAAFHEIDALGRQDGFEDGYANYVRFMESVHENLISGLRPELLGPDPEGANADLPITVQLLRDGSFVSDVQLTRQALRGCFHDIKSGEYQIVSGLGQMIWQALLSDRQLIWRDAFPEKGLPLAAATSSGESHPSQQDVLLGGALKVCVLPGLEGGVIEIVCDFGANK